MTKDQINKLLLKGGFPEACANPTLVETHISWVILCDDFVYKIKKPMVYSFLDFSTLEKRKYYCEREVELNKRLTEDIYLEVKAVKEIPGEVMIGGDYGVVIDYAVRMKKIDRNRQMDRLLVNNNVSVTDIQNLAEKIAVFHKNAIIIRQKDYLEVQNKFNDLSLERDYLKAHLDENSARVITHSIDITNKFVKKNKGLLENRIAKGFFRDCHGDLHSRNIFLLATPQPFDCIEFNDDYRQIDVLNEVAFLCMDLEAFNRKDLSDRFINFYTDYFPSIKAREDYKLFIYYKSYRANIRAKVNSLRARDSDDNKQRKVTLDEVNKYLHLMDSYVKELE